MDLPKLFKIQRWAWPIWVQSPFYHHDYLSSIGEQMRDYFREWVSCSVQTYGHGLDRIIMSPNSFEGLIKWLWRDWLRSNVRADSIIHSGYQTKTIKDKALKSIAFKGKFRKWDFNKFWEFNYGSRDRIIDGQMFPYELIKRVKY